MISKATVLQSYRYTTGGVIGIMAHREKVPVSTILVLITCVVSTKLVVFNQALPAIAQTTTAQTDVNSPLIDDGELSDSDQLAQRGRWWWLLLPLAGLALLIWAANKSIHKEKADDTLSADLDTVQNDRISSGFDNDISTSAEQIPNTNTIIQKMPNDISTSAEQIPNTNTIIQKMPDANISNASTPQLGVVAFEPTEEELSADTVATDGDLNEATTDLNEATTIVGTLRTAKPELDNMQDDLTATDSSGPINSSTEHGNSDSDSNVSQSMADDVGAKSIDSASRSTVREGLGRTRSDIRESTGSVDSRDWLQRAKQRINEATEQTKQTAAEIEDDATRER